MSESLTTLLDHVALVLLAGAAVTLFGMLLGGVRSYSFSRPERDANGQPKRFPRIVIVFFSLILLTFACDYAVVWSARDTVMSALDPVARPRLGVQDGASADLPALLDALRHMRSIEGHHSHPGQRIAVDIESVNGPIRVELAQDSDRPREYWVFVPRYRVTSGLEIARIQTTALGGR